MNASRIKIGVATLFMALFVAVSAYALNNSSIITGSSAPGQLGTATISFNVTASVNWPNNGRLVIDFPAGFDLSQIGVTDASSPDNTVDGGLTVAVAGTTVTITRSGDGTLITNRDCRINLANVINPSAIGTTGTFTITLTDATPTNLDVDTMAGVSISEPVVLGGSSSGSSGSSVCLVNGPSLAHHKLLVFVVFISLLVLVAARRLQRN